MHNNCITSAHTFNFAPGHCKRLFGVPSLAESRLHRLCDLDILRQKKTLKPFKTERAINKIAVETQEQ